MEGKKNRLYIACSWFTPEQKRILKVGYEALQQNPTVDWANSYRPLDHQYQGWNTENHPELLGDRNWEIATFNNDLLGMRRCDVAVFLYNDEEDDPGQAFELGFCKATYKPCIFVTREKQVKKPLNLMLAGAPDRFLTLAELADFNFNNIEFDFYEGSVY